MHKNLSFIVLLTVLFSNMAAYADDSEYAITEKNKQFSPQVLTVPAGQKIRITVKNEDSTPAEFESADFDREKVVAANSSIIVSIGPLDAGKYSYVDDFHHESTGTIIAK